MGDVAHKGHWHILKLPMQFPGRHSATVNFPVNPGNLIASQDLLSLDGDTLGLGFFRFPGKPLAKKGVVCILLNKLMAIFASETGKENKRKRK